MVLSKVLHHSSVHSLKVNLLHRHSNLPPALLLLMPVPQLKLTKDQLSNGNRVKELLKPRDLLLVKALLSEVREGRLKLRGNNPCSSRKHLQEALARNRQANHSRCLPTH